MSKLRLIYITGLGSEGRGQRLAVKIWRLYGAETRFMEMKWGDGELWEPKFARLLKLIDDARRDGRQVGLVAVSAGACAAIQAYAARPEQLAGLVLIAGKVNRPEAVSHYHDKHNPAFVEAIRQTPAALAALNDRQRKRILCRYAIADELVKRDDSFIPGARNRRVPSAGHLLTIAVQITAGAPSFIHFLRKMAKR